MKNDLHALAIAIAATILCSCSDEIKLAGNVSQVEITINDYFNGLGVQDGLELTFEPNDDGRRIAMETDANILPYVKYEIKRGILHFYLDKSKEIPNDTKVKIKVYADSINMLTAAEATVSIAETLKVSSLTINFMETSSFRSGTVECVNLSIKLNGGSTVGLTGSAANLALRSSGGSFFKSFGLEADDVRLNVSGGSTVELTVNDKLSVEAFEGSAIIYDGNPEIGTLTLMNGSRLDRRK